MSSAATLEECREIFAAVESYSRVDEEGRAAARRAYILGGAVPRLAASLALEDCSYDLCIAALACISELAFAVGDVELLERFRTTGADAAALRILTTAGTIEAKTWAAFALCNMNANSTSGLQRTWDLGVVAAAVTTVAVALAADEALRDAGVSARAPVHDFSVTPPYELPMVPALAEPLAGGAGASLVSAAAALCPAERAGRFASTPESLLMARVSTLGPCRLISMCLGLMTMFAREDAFARRLRGLTLGQCAAWREAVAAGASGGEAAAVASAAWFRAQRARSRHFAAGTSALALALEAVAVQDTTTTRTSARRSSRTRWAATRATTTPGGRKRRRRRRAVADPARVAATSAEEEEEGGSRRRACASPRPSFKCSWPLRPPASRISSTVASPPTGGYGRTSRCGGADGATRLLLDLPLPPLCTRAAARDLCDLRRQQSRHPSRRRRRHRSAGPLARRPPLTSRCGEAPVAAVL